ncbi:hypothetical protein M9H77_24238 [Catharanthus roseus]|uniref:Uncharacterized protein n=1 Tax=Catharanthus roseus TaxID=4058 RepID=A0ACC0AVK6_CATRO|nr:hypothetical protein M9H77_24238 [Catharanthus roseus]
MADKYKKDLEKSRREQIIILDQVKVLEKKLAEAEAANATLTETNSSLTEINERLTDECAPKDRIIQSLNDLLLLARQEIEEHKAELARKCWENDAINSDLSEIEGSSARHEEVSSEDEQGDQGDFAEGSREGQNEDPGRWIAVPNRRTFRDGGVERTEIEQADAAGVTMPLRQV